MALFLSHKIPSGERSAYEARLRQMAVNLGIDNPEAPNWLMGLMDLESGINPSIKNGIGCVGQIQFCPDVAGGTTKTIGGRTVSLPYLQTLSRTEQLEYVEQYLADVIRQTKRIPKSFVDLQLMIFLPAALKFDYEEPIFIKSTAFMDSVKKNNPLYIDPNGNITKKSIESVYKKRYAGLFEAVKQVAAETAEKTEKVVQSAGTIIIENRIPVIAGGMLLIIASLLLLFYYKNRQKWQQTD